MRGPGYKTAGDVRRTWRCSQCGRERKLGGEITSLQCDCQPDRWMQIVSERIQTPRPLQRPSDVERRPIDFGIEPTPPQPTRPAATIIKPAIARDQEPEIKAAGAKPESELVAPPAPVPEEIPVEPAEEEWGEGIL
ncbi:MULTISPECIES: hypothetical protein [unclassified Schlesneria]|uniref:hypothetical protein n=1 Tax=Schlesneria TaxID=656899 RepID=UPI002F165CA1